MPSRVAEWAAGMSVHLPVADRQFLVDRKTMVAPVLCPNVGCSVLIALQGWEVKVCIN